MQNRIIVILLVCLIGRVATADVIVDQENIGHCCITTFVSYPGEYLAQTFTVNNGGQLMAVGIQVATVGYDFYKPVTDDLYVTLMRTDPSGIPAIGAILASRVVSRFAVPRWSSNTPILDVDFSDVSLDVHVGDVLAIALTSNHTSSDYPSNYLRYGWHTGIMNPHPGGALYGYSPRDGDHTFQLVTFSFPPPNDTVDMGFRVLINVPEPSSLAIMAPLVAMFFPRRRVKWTRCCYSPGRSRKV
jgi:hypothetical protein